MGVELCCTDRLDRRDDVIVRTMRSTGQSSVRESLSDRESGSVEGSTLPGGVEGMDPVASDEGEKSRTILTMEGI